MKRKCGCNRCINIPPEVEAPEYVNVPNNRFRLPDGTYVTRRLWDTWAANGPRTAAIHTVVLCDQFLAGNPAPEGDDVYLWRLPTAPFYEWRRFNG